MRNRTVSLFRIFVVVMAEALLALSVIACSGLASRKDTEGRTVAGNAFGSGDLQGSAGQGSSGIDPRDTDVSVDIAQGSLAGTLRVPEGAGPFPVVLIIAGSGPTDRNGNSPLLQGSNDSLKMIAVELEKAGIASLRYDKRGIAESASAAVSEENLRFDTYVADAAALVRYLRTREGFGRIGILGHSEGALVGAAAAAMEPVDCLVSVSGAGRPSDVILKEQLSSTPAAERDRIYRIIDELKAGRLVPDVPQSLYMLFRPSVQPYLISWFAYDPVAILDGLHIPILVIQGTTDLQISVDDAKLLAPEGRGRQLIIVEGMNHVLKIAPWDRKKNLAAYSDPTLPLAPGFVSGVIAFLRQNLL